MGLIEFKDYPDTSTPLNAENLNNNFNELNKANTYSTEEQVVGTWMGKPLYRRVLQYTAPTSSEFTRVIELEEFLDVQRFYGSFFYQGNTNQKNPLPYGEGQYFNNVIIQNNFILAAQNGFQNSPCTLVIEYTKTTD